MRMMAGAVALALMVLAGCSGTKKDKHNHALSFSSASSLIGQWEQISMVVEFDATTGKDESRVLEVNQDNWKEKTDLFPVRTWFREDRTYEMELKRQADSTSLVLKGHWEMTGDSLFLDQTHPHWASYAYKLEVDPKRIKMKSVLDWDGDGKIDDIYSGEQRRIY